MVERLVVPRVVWHWLVQSGAVAPRDASDADDALLVSDELMQRLASGVVFGHVLGTRLKSVQSVEQRMRNWNALGDSLARYGIAVDAQAQGLMAAGDAVVLADALIELYESFHAYDCDSDASAFFLPAAASEDDEDAQTLEATSRVLYTPSANTNDVDDNNNGDDELLQCLSASLACQLGVGEARARALLSGDRAQLGEYLCSGRGNGNGNGNGRRDFDGVAEWVRSSYIDSARLTLLAGPHPSRFRLLLDVFTPGLLSRDYEVAMWSARLLARLAYDMCLASPEHAQHAWHWFVQEPHGGGGLHALLACYTRHSDLLLALFPLIEHIAASEPSRLVQLFAHELPARVPDPVARLGLLHELLAPLAVSAGLSRGARVTEHVVQIVLESATAHAAAGEDDELRTSALGLLGEVWRQFPREIEALRDAPEQVLDQLRKGCREHSSRAVQVTSLTCLFGTLDAFSQTQNAFAPKVYKTLIFSLIENYEDAFVREYITANLSLSLRLLPRMPVSVLLEPLVKQVALHGCSNVDFDFFLVLAKHPALPLRHALLFMHLLGKMTVDDVSYGRLASLPFLLLVNRFHEEAVIHDYVSKFVTVALTIFLKASNSSDVDDDASRRQARRILTLEIIAKLCHLHHAQLDLVMQPLLESALQRYRSEHGHGHPSLEALDDYLVNQAQYDLDELEDMQLRQLDTDRSDESDEAKDEDEELHIEPDPIAQQQQEVVEEEKEVVVHSLQKSRAPPSSPRRKERRKHESPARSSRRTKTDPPPPTRPTAVQTEEKERKKKTKPKEKESVSRVAKAPRRPSQAEIDIEAIEAQKRRDEARRKQSEEERRVRQERIHKQLQARRQQERLHAKRLQAQQQKKALAAATTTTTTTTTTGEEQDDRNNQAPAVPAEAMGVLRRHRRQLRALFRAYQGIRPQMSRFDTFERISRAKKCMSHSDFLKLWEDMRVYPLLLSKPVMSALFRTANSGSLSYHLLSFADFLSAVWEVAHAIAILDAAPDDSPAQQVGSLLRMLQDESIGNNTVAPALWLDVDQTEVEAAEATATAGGRAARSSLSRSRSKAASRVSTRAGACSTPNGTEAGDAVGAAATVLGEIISSAFGYSVDSEQLVGIALGRHGVGVVSSAVRSKEAERERKRRKRKEQLAAQLEKQRHETRLKEKQRLQDERQQKELEIREQKLRRQKLAKEREETRKKLEEYRKKKNIEEHRKKQIELKKKELEREERRRNVELYLKQKKEREEIHKRTVNELSKLEAPTATADASTKPDELTNKPTTPLSNGPEPTKDTDDEPHEKQVMAGDDEPKEKQVMAGEDEPHEKQEIADPFSAAAEVAK